MKKAWHFLLGNQGTIFRWFFLMALGTWAYAVMADPRNVGLWIFWVWGLWLGLAALRREAEEPAELRPDWLIAGLAAWSALAVAGRAAWNEGTDSLMVGWALFFWWEGFCAWRGSRRLARRMLLPGLVVTVLVTSQETFYWLLSYPMSRFCTLFTVELLNLFDLTAISQGTLIYLGNEVIAVTTACSGVELLEAMLILGWIIVTRTDLPLWIKCLWYASMLPVIVAINSLRLLLVTCCYVYGHIPAFSEPLHSVFGFAVLLLVIGVMLGLGELFRLLAAYCAGKGAVRG